jgi:hypothetical protein
MPIALTPWTWFLYLLATSGGIVALGMAALVLTLILGWARTAEQSETLPEVIE